MRSFASDNNSGISTEVLQSIIEANVNHVLPYGNDIYTEKALTLLKKTFGEQAIAFFVNNGTAANVLSLSAMTRSYNAIICANSAHIINNEVGALVNFSGCSIFTIPHQNGKILASLLEEKYLTSIHERHNNIPTVVSISQSTEYGTVYSIDELQSIAKICKKYQLFFHIDGCRLSNAAVALNKSLKEITTDIGADVVTFGGTKNGLLFGEAIIFLREEFSDHFSHIQKQGLQLNSKMRFLSAQFIPYLEKNIWQRNALHANLICHKLAERLIQINDIKLLYPIETNQLFAYFPKSVIQATQDKFRYYILDEKAGLVRIVTSFDTCENDVEEFVSLALTST